jgi:hypothetical protein
LESIFESSILSGPFLHSGKCDVFDAPEDAPDTISILTKLRLPEIVPDIQQICSTGTATCMRSTRNNSRPSDIPHFSCNSGATNIATDTQRISVDLCTSGDTIKPNQCD